MALFVIHTFVLMISLVSCRRVTASRVKAEAAAHEADLKRHQEVTQPFAATLQKKGLGADGLPAPLSDSMRQSNRASTGFTWDMLKMRDTSYTETFCSRSKDGCKTVDGYPGGFSHSELSFKTVTDVLPDIPGMEESGQIRRLGDLGYFIFNSKIWDEDWKTFPIGADFQDHRKHRPTADILMGSNSPAWDRQMITNHVQDFFNGRKTIDKEALNLFVIRLLHKILLDMDLNDIEVLDFQKYMEKSIGTALLPTWLTGTMGDVTWCRKQRNLWLEKYEHAMDRDTRGISHADGSFIWGGASDLKGRDRRFLADLLLTTMTSAGGLSVPSVMEVVLAVVYGGETSPWKVADRSLTHKNIMPLVLEAIRRFPAVVGFASWTPDQQKRNVLNLAMALRDPNAWTEAEEFKLRPLSEYHSQVGSGTKIGVAWAEQAKGHNGLTADSRGCPGQELSIVIVTEFFRALRPIQKRWVVTRRPKSGIKIIEGPCRATPFTLTFGADPDAPPETTDDPPGRSESLTDEEAAAAGMSMAGTGNVISHKTPRFLCPMECQECCKKENNFGLFRTQVDAKFKCVMPAADVAEFNIVGRTCSKATLRNSDKSQGKSTCELTDSELELGLQDQLLACTYDPIEQTYAEFLGEKRGIDYCSVSHIGTWVGLEVIGSVIDSMYFTVSSDITGGVCGGAIPSFMGGGLLQNMCGKAGLRMKECGKAEMKGLCKQLQDDMDGGRLDGVSMAMWAAAVGPLQTKTDLPKPIGNRLLKKFKISGWKTRSVAFEAPSWDKQIDLAGGGFQCMMKKIAKIPVFDDFTEPGRNNWVDKWEAGVGSVSALAAQQDSTDTLMAYYDRFEVYQKPQHFVIPADELQTDLTLEKLVFQSIGAHRVEPIGKDGRTINLNPIGLHGLPTAAMVGSPGLLETLPIELQKKAAYLVRMEGLFDKLPLREGMQCWGGNAFFSKQGKLLALQYRGETVVKGQDDEKWAVFKFIFRASLVSTITAFDHLVSTHILASESLAIATIETLPDTHGLRLILTPHVWGTLNINMKAATNLFSKRMLVHRASPFGDEAFLTDSGDDGMLWKMIPALRYTTFMDTYARYTEFADAETEEIPFFVDGKLYYDALSLYISHAVYKIYDPTTSTLKVDNRRSDAPGQRWWQSTQGCSANLQSDERVQNFVNNFFNQNADTPDFWPADYRDAAFDCNKLVDFLTEMIFLVTGWHRHVGTVADFFRDTRFAATSWKEGETQARPKHTMLMQLLAATTNAVYPRLTSHLKDIYSRDYIFRDVFDHFHQSMTTVQSEVERRNVEREKIGRMGFHQMEPQFLEWGVQV